jgi:hypothetical protein
MAIDANRDGRTDLLVLNGASTNQKAILDVLLGNGDGTFQSPVSYQVPGVLSAFGLTSGDFNRDGFIDIAAVGQNQNSVGRIGILLGNGDGTFRAGASYAVGSFYSVFSGAAAAAAADVTGDGILDLVVGGCSNINCTASDGVVSVLAGNGNGSFQPATTYDAGPTSASFVNVADLNGDKKPDIAVAHWFVNTSTILLNNTNPFSHASSALLTSSLSHSIFGQKVTYVAAVTNDVGSPATGPVSFKCAGNKCSLGSATLDSTGVATVVKNLNAGSYSLIAVYNGDANNGSSVSAILNQTVSPTTTTSTLTSTPNPSAAGQSVTFTAKIKPATAVAPTGSVTFSAGNTVLGTVATSGGKAVLSISSLPSGSTVVTSDYLGNHNIEGSSATVTQVVQ